MPPAGSIRRPAELRMAGGGELEGRAAKEVASPTCPFRGRRPQPPAGRGCYRRSLHQLFRNLHGVDLYKRQADSWKPCQRHVICFNKQDKAMKILMPIMAAGCGLFLIVAPVFAQTWMPTSAPNINWYAVASSADGTKLVAVGVSSGIYISTNSG